MMKNLPHQIDPESFCQLSKEELVIIEQQIAHLVGRIPKRILIFDKFLSANTKFTFEKGGNLIYICQSHKYGIYIRADPPF